MEVQYRVSVSPLPLPPALIVQATAEGAHREYYKLQHKPRLRWSGAFMQGPLWGRREPNTAIRAPTLLLLWLVAAKKGLHGVP